MTARRDMSIAGGLPVICIRIRVAGEARFAAVQRVMLAAMRAYVWRLSFTGLRSGQEVEIGRLRVEQEEPWLGLGYELSEPAPRPSEWWFPSQNDSPGRPPAPSF